MKVLVYGIFVVIYGLISFFGIGPVLLADGSMQERLWTLLVVVILYLAVTWLLVVIIRRMKR